MTTPNPTPVEQTAPPTPSVAAPAPSPADKAAASKRKPWLIALTVIFVLAGVAYGIYWFIYAKFFIDTDNAYVSGNVVQITPQTAGTVIGVNADDTDFVQTGQVLITLDRADAQLALDAAQTQLAQTIREVKSVFAGDATAQAVVAQRQEDVARSTADLARRQSLAGTGAVAGEEIAHARDMVKEAQTALNTAREQAAANRSFTDHTTPRTHPNVQRAVLKVREAQLALERTTVASPITGYVAHRTAQPGQRVNIGMPLMAVIPLDQLWVDANFKEGQLADMRIGQPVEMHADVYGSDVAYHGHVIGFAAGTGSAFSLLPAQNATGNWIKVVQRLPVRIGLDPHEVAKHPLRIGLSMRADVDTHDRSGQLIATTPRQGTVSSTAIYQQQDQGARTAADASLNRE